MLVIFKNIFFVPSSRRRFFTSSHCSVNVYFARSLPKISSCYSLKIFYFHTSFAISFTSFNFAHCSSTVSLLPISHEAKPHCGLKYKRSNGTYFAASWILAITSSFFSNAGDLVVTSPRTTFLSPETLAKGAKPPDLSSSYSR